MATDGNGDGEEPKTPMPLPLRPREHRPQLASAPPAIPKDPRARLSNQRAAFLTTYLGLLQEPDVVNHVRTILSSGKASDVAAVLSALVRVLIPAEKGSTSPVQINLSHGVPRPPLDVTP
jgi:hypothetical protein